MRLADYVRCSICSWQYGNIFHICIPNPDTTVIIKPKRAKNRQVLGEYLKGRWERHREANRDRDEAIVQRYLKGDVGVKKVAEEFGIAYQTARGVIDRAGVMRSKGYTLSRPGNSPQNA